MNNEKIIQAIKIQIKKDAYAYSMAWLENGCESDVHASQYGALTPNLASQLEVNPDTLRRRLNKMASDGLIIKNRPYPCTIRWWPIGHLAEIQQQGID